MIKPDVTVVTLDPGFNGMPSLFNVDLLKLAGDTIDAWCFEAIIILDGLKEIGYPPRHEVYSSDVMS